MTMKTHKIISDGRTLRALQRAGHIAEPPQSLRPKGQNWGAGYCYVEAGHRNHFTHGGKQYWLAYRDGCFLPFVFTAT
jgi:hypothetical protein